MECFTSWKTGSHCSRTPIASALPVTSPSGSTVKYFPYPDLRAIFVSETCTAVRISSASGPSPVQKYCKNAELKFCINATLKQILTILEL